MTVVADPGDPGGVGDTRVDLEGGSNAGRGLVIGVTTGTFSRADLMCPATDFPN